MSETAEKIRRVTLSTLTQRGWTGGAVKRFLGELDALVTNPNYGSGPRMRRYDLLRVERAEQSEAWRAGRDQTTARRDKASVRQSERMSASRAALIAQINAVKIRIPRLPGGKTVRCCSRPPQRPGRMARRRKGPLRLRFRHGVLG